MKGESAFVGMSNIPTNDELNLINQFRQTDYRDRISENSDFKFVSRFAKEGLDDEIQRVAAYDQTKSKITDNRQANSMGFQRPNKMLEAKDPKTSIVSIDSAALDRINKRNADRLAKLENHDEVGSAFYD